MSWEKVKLTELCEINVGKTPSRDKSDYFGVGESWASIADMNGVVYLTNTKEQITKDGILSANMKLVPKNTVIFSFKLSVGKVCITGKPLYTNEAIAALPIKNLKTLDTKYLYYAMQAQDFSHLGERAAKGLTLNKEKLTRIKIPLPPIPIQQKIAAILDQADALRKKDKQLQAKYDELLQAVFYEMFGDPVKNEKGWEVKTLGEICYSIKDGPHVSPKYTQTGIPFISVNNIIKGYWDFSNVKYISEADYEDYKKKCNPEYGDVLYTKGGTTGFAKFVDLKIKFANWVHLAVLKFDPEKIDGRFLEVMLNTDFCYSQSQRNTRGIANRDLVLGEMKKIKVLFPPLKMQKKLSSLSQSIQHQKEQVKKQVQQSEALFQSLLQRAFKGELVNE